MNCSRAKSYIQYGSCILRLSNTSLIAEPELPFEKSIYGMHALRVAISSILNFSGSVSLHDIPITICAIASLRASGSCSFHLSSMCCNHWVSLRCMQSAIILCHTLPCTTKLYSGVGLYGATVLEK